MRWMLAFTEQEAIRKDTKIASLRAELDESLRDYFRSQQEIDRLRAELADAQSGSELAARQLMRASEKVNNLEAAARQDAETTASLRAEIEKAHDVLCLLPSECDLVTACRHAIENMLESEREVKTLRAAFSRDAETIARLEERVAELYRAQKNRILSVKSTEYDIGTLQETIARLRRCLAFFASVIKSGESWSETCEEEYRAAIADGGLK